MNYILISFHKAPRVSFERNVLPNMGKELYKIHKTCFILVTETDIQKIRAKLVFQYPEMEEFLIYPITKEHKDEILTTSVSSHEELNNFKRNYIEELNNTEENLNYILDKINKEGYENLQPIEKDFLNKFSYQ